MRFEYDENASVTPLVATFPSIVPEAALSGDDSLTVKPVCDASLPGIDYIASGSGFSLESDSASYSSIPLRSYLGVRTPSGAIRIVPIARNAPVAFNGASAPASREETTVGSRYLAQARLTETFASRRQQTILANMQRNRVTVDNIDADTLGTGLAAINVGADDVQFTATTANILPPHDLDATEAADTYPIEGLIPPGDIELSISRDDYYGPLLDAAGDDNELHLLEQRSDVPGFYSQTCLALAYNLTNETDPEKRAVIARRIYLLNLYIRFRSVRDTTRGLRERMPYTPGPVLTWLVDTFADERVDAIGKTVRTITTESRLRLENYILVLAAHLGGGSVSPHFLSLDLRRTPADLAARARSIGLSGTRANLVPRATLAASFRAPDSGAIGLKAPLVLGGENTQMRRRTNGRR